VAKPNFIELPDGTVIPILYEDRAVLAIDKPAGWMLAPDSWTQTGRNLHLALQSSLQAGDFWARSRNLKYLRFVHRLDAETTGVLLLAKSPGALTACSELFESHRTEKTYLAVVHGAPPEPQWTCSLKLATYEKTPGLMRLDERHGKEAETIFRVLKSGPKTTLIEARPVTGRTHQIRLHLLAAGCPVVGDVLYGPEKGASTRGRARLALRAIQLAYPDPFQRRTIRIEAPTADFLKEYGFN
jgi:RluA family pseudouridine synthase